MHSEMHLWRKKHLNLKVKVNPSMHPRTNPKTYTEIHLRIKFRQSKRSPTICVYFVWYGMSGDASLKTEDIFNFLPNFSENQLSL